MLVSAIIALTRDGGEMTLGGEFTGGESSWWRGDYYFAAHQSKHGRYDL